MRPYPCPVAQAQTALAPTVKPTSSGPPQVEEHPVYPLHRPPMTPHPVAIYANEHICMQPTVISDHHPVSPVFIVAAQTQYDPIPAP
jgi:hypothetical protein